MMHVSKRLCNCLYCLGQQSIERSNNGGFPFLMVTLTCSRLLGWDPLLVSDLVLEHFSCCLTLIDSRNAPFPPTVVNAHRSIALLIHNAYSVRSIELLSTGYSLIHKHNMNLSYKRTSDCVCSFKPSPSLLLSTLRQFLSYILHVCPFFIFVSSFTASTWPSIELVSLLIICYCDITPLLASRSRYCLADFDSGHSNPSFRKCIWKRRSESVVTV